MPSPTPERIAELRKLAHENDEAYVAFQRAAFDSPAASEQQRALDAREKLTQALLKNRDDLLDVAEENAKRIEPKMFPIQKSTPVPWVEAERAWRTYAKEYGISQSLERLAERGGFGVREFACLWNGHNPMDCPHGDACCAFPEFELIKLAEENARLRAEQQAVEAQLGLLDDVQRKYAQLRAAVEPLRPWLRKCLERYRPDAADDIQPSFEVQIALGVLRALLAAMEPELEVKS